MSQPRNRVRELREILPGLLHARVHDDRLDFRSDAFACQDADGRRVWVDPLPLEPALEEAAGAVEAVVLSGAFHQRAAWEFRRRQGCPVLLPEGAAATEEPPDAGYRPGDALPGGLRAVDAPGPTSPHVSFLFEAGGRRVLYLGDLLVRAGEEPWCFVPAAHQDDPARSRESVRRLLDFGPEVLLSAHGEPQLGGAMAALEQALREDRELDLPS